MTPPLVTVGSGVEREVYHLRNLLHEELVQMEIEGEDYYQET